MTPDDGKLVGTWKLVSASSADSSGQKLEPPYGANPVGFLTYGEDGRVTALISFGGRRPLSMGAKPPALQEEQAEAFKTFLAYGGRYRLSGDKVIHSIEVSSIQNFVNKGERQDADHRAGVAAFETRLVRLTDCLRSEDSI